MSALNRWVGRPVLELAYVVVSLLLGIVTFTVTVTGLALSIGLLPAFLLGLPTLLATVYVVHGMAVMERHRAELFMDTALPARSLPDKPGQNWLSRAFARLGSPEFWKEAAYCLLLLPVGVLTGSLALAFWSVAVAGLLLPLYAARLPGDAVITWLHWSNALEVVAGFAVGLVFALMARLVTRGLAVAHLAMASALLSPSKSDALRAQVTQLTATRTRVVDAADAERRRIERDLHDGAQQQSVSLAMNLWRAKAKLDTDPEGPGSWSPRLTRRPRTPWSSCATSPGVCTLSYSPTAGSTPRCRRSPPARRCRCGWRSPCRGGRRPPSRRWPTSSSASR